MGELDKEIVVLRSGLSEIEKVFIIFISNDQLECFIAKIQGGKIDLVIYDI